MSFIHVSVSALHPFLLLRSNPLLCIVIYSQQPVGYLEIGTNLFFTDEEIKNLNEVLQAPWLAHGRVLALPPTLPGLSA